jgi:stalled ribosome rescue protein Dom34
MRALLDQYRKVASVVLDARTAEIAIYYMGEALHHEVIEAEELRKSNLAGWYALEEYRHRLHAEEVRHHLFRDVAERLDRLRRDLGIELVFVGGQTEVTEALLPFLDPKLRAMTETFVIDLHTLTPAILATRIIQLEEVFERREESSLVDEVYALFDAGDLGIVGLEWVLRAANRHAIAHLLVHDGAVVEGSLCLVCGALSPRVEECPECGEQTEDIPDLFEALTRAVVDAGGAVEHVMAPTRLAEDLVAARLRFSPW